MIVKGNFKEVPIGYEFKFGSYMAIKISDTHGSVKFANGTTREQYFYPTLCVEYNQLYPQLNRTDTKIKR